MLVSDLQSWGRCKGCGQVLWCEISPDAQACGCACGGLRLCNRTTLCDNGKDPDFTEDDMQAILDVEYGN